MKKLKPAVLTIMLIVVASCQERTKPSVDTSDLPDTLRKLDSQYKVDLQKDVDSIKAEMKSGTDSLR